MPSFHDITVTQKVPWFSGTGGKSKMRQYVQLSHADRQSVKIVMQVKQQKLRRYRLSKESCEEAGELMQLKGVVATEFTEVNEWLAKHPLKRWAHLKNEKK